MAANQDFNLGSTIPTGSAPAASAAKPETSPPVLRYADRPECQEILRFRSPR